MTSAACAFVFYIDRVLFTIKGNPDMSGLDRNLANTYFTQIVFAGQCARGRVYIYCMVITWCACMRGNCLGCMTGYCLGCTTGYCLVHGFWDLWWMVLCVGGCLSVGPTFMCVGDPTFTPEFRVSKDGIPTIEESASYMQKAACMGVCRATA